MLIKIRPWFLLAAQRVGFMTSLKVIQEECNWEALVLQSSPGVKGAWQGCHHAGAVWRAQARDPSQCPQARDPSQCPQPRDPSQCLQAMRELLCLGLGLPCERSEHRVWEQHRQTGVTGRARLCLVVEMESGTPRDKSNSFCIWQATLTRTNNISLWIGAEGGLWDVIMLSSSPLPFLVQLSAFVTLQCNTLLQKLWGDFNHKDEIHPCATPSGIWDLSSQRWT